jgi:hypothetical protein
MVLHDKCAIENSVLDSRRHVTLAGAWRYAGGRHLDGLHPSPNLLATFSYPPY